MRSPDLCQQPQIGPREAIGPSRDGREAQVSPSALLSVHDAREPAATACRANQPSSLTCGRTSAQAVPNRERQRQRVKSWPSRARATLARVVTDRFALGACDASTRERQHWVVAVEREEHARTYAEALRAQSEERP